MEIKNKRLLEIKERVDKMTHTKEQRWSMYISELSKSYIQLEKRCDAINSFNNKLIDKNQELKYNVECLKRQLINRM